MGVQVFEATFAIRDALTDRIEAVYGLTTMHGCVKSFTSIPPPASVEDSAELKTMSYCFGLSALGKFIRRLPGEILEEELPRLKDILTSVGAMLIATPYLLIWMSFLLRLSRTLRHCWSVNLQRRSLSLPNWSYGMKLSSSRCLMGYLTTRRTF